MSTNRTTRWWREDQPHEAIARVIDHIRGRQGWRRRAYEYHAELYGGGPGAGALSSYSGATDYIPTSLPYNVVRSGVDTLTSKISKNKPLPQCLTTKGDFLVQKRARRMNQFIEGQFYRVKFHERLSPMQVRDALIFGMGVLYNYIDRSGKKPKICSDRIFPWELYVDDYDAKYGDPRNFYIVKTIDKEVLKELYPGHDDDIDNCGLLESYEDVNDIDGDATVDRAHVILAWHLGESEEKPGRFCVAVSNCTLEDSEYKRDYAPLSVLNYSEPVAGFHGIGLAEISEGFQYELNTVGMKVQEQHHMLGSGWVLCPSGPGSVKEGDITNGLRVLHHAPGLAPTVVLNQPTHPQTYQYLRDLTPDALSYMGISSMSARSEKPAGVTAAIALDALTDVETERFQTFGTSHQACCVETARQYIDLAQEIGEEDKDFAMSVPTKKGLKSVKWSEARIEDEWLLQVTPTNSLSKNWGQKLQQVLDLKERGDAFQDRATFLKLLELPDLEGAIDLETSPQAVIEEQLSDMLDHDNPEDEDAFEQPEPFFDLVWASKLAQLVYCQVRKQKNVPEATLELLRRYWSECDRLDALKNPPPPPAPPMPMGAPPMGGPPPDGGMPMPAGPMPGEMPPQAAPPMAA